MAFFGDMQQAIQDYPSIALTYSFEDLAIVTGTGGSVNVNEVWKFKVRVANSGALNMDSVTLHLNGEDAEVGASSAGPWTTENITTAAFDVPAHGSKKTDFYYFKAPAAASGGVTDLVSVHLNSWDADLEQILLDQSGHNVTPTATYAAEVHP